MRRLNDSTETSLERKVEHLSIEALSPYPRNARTHSKSQIREIARSIERFGFTNPVLIDEAGQIIAGHGRIAAARLLGMKRVPTLRIDHLTEAEKRAYILADNRLAEKAGWDRDTLAIELQALIDADFEVELRRQAPALRTSPSGIRNTGDHRAGAACASPGRVP